MAFSSLFFLYLFLPICLIVYAAAKDIRHRNIVLVIFSLIFYAWGEPLWIILLIFSVASAYFHALLIEKFRGKKGSKIALASSLVISISLLVVFKYSAFIVNNINAVGHLSLPVPDITLPIGISFYTFQIISYLVDCYWEKIDAQKSFLKLLMYVSLFPQLVAGPIVRYSTIAEQIDNRHATVDDMSKGFTRIITGLAKKVIIANNLSTITNAIFGGDISALSVSGTWYGAAVFALQVYFDFSGYSDMAIGLGRIFGFKFDENFNHPFVSKSITEFWQRWHISLGSFFRDYLLYVPVFGKRRKYFNLFLVWFCTGIWHGASWNYIIWGLYFGIFIFIESRIGKKKFNSIPAALRHIYTILILIIGFGIFYFEDISKLGTFFKNIFLLSGNPLIDEITKISAANNLFLLIAAVILCLPWNSIIDKIKQKSDYVSIGLESTHVVVNAALLVISSIMLVDSTNNPFLYFRF